MSRSGGSVVTFAGEHVGHVLYDGSCDVLRPWITETPREAWTLDDADDDAGCQGEHWDRLETCEHEPEVGYAQTSYGGGSYWPVRFCRECRVVRGPLSPWWVLEGSDAPASWLGNWPKSGTAPIDPDPPNFNVKELEDGH